MSMSAENLWKGIPMNDEAPQRACVGCGVEGLDAVKHGAVCVDCGMLPGVRGVWYLVDLHGLFSTWCMMTGCDVLIRRILSTSETAPATQSANLALGDSYVVTGRAT